MLTFSDVGVAVTRGVGVFVAVAAPAVGVFVAVAATAVLVAVGGTAVLVRVAVAATAVLVAVGGTVTHRIGVVAELRGDAARSEKSVMLLSVSEHPSPIPFELRKEPRVGIGVVAGPKPGAGVAQTTPGLPSQLFGWDVAVD